VRHVRDHTPAAEAGLRPGDLLVDADGAPLLSCVDLADRTAHARSDRSPLELGVLRGEQERTVHVTVRS
jgi:S1-C subfamily serine protease